MAESGEKKVLLREIETLKAERDSLKANARLHVDGEVMRRLSNHSGSSDGMVYNTWNLSPTDANSRLSTRLFFDAPPSADRRYEVDIRDTSHVVVKDTDEIQAFPMDRHSWRPHDVIDEPRIAVHLTEVEAMDVAYKSAPIDLSPPYAVK